MAQLKQLLKLREARSQTESRSWKLGADSPLKQAVPDQFVISVVLSLTQLQKHDNVKQEKHFLVVTTEAVTLQVGEEHITK